MQMSTKAIQSSREKYKNNPQIAEGIRKCFEVVRKVIFLSRKTVSPI